MHQASEKVIDSEFSSTLHFEDFIREASAKFISIETSLIDEAITDALKYVVESSTLSRGFIFLLTESQGEFSIAYEYRKEGIPPYNSTLQNLKESEYSIFVSRLKKGKYTALNLEEICKEPIDEVRKVVERMETMSIKSFINLPIVVGENFMGFIGFHDCENNRYWDKREIENFQMAGEVLGNAIYRKIGDEKLRKSQLKYHTITEISPVGIFQTDRRGRLIYVNKRWTEMSGLNEEQALGDKWTKALSREDREEATVNWIKFIKNPAIPFEQEFRFKRSDNRLVWLLAQVNPEYDINDTLIGYIGTLTDITATKRIQRDREILLEELKIKNKELQQFTDTVSHDLKSPLITIKGFLGILEEDINNGLKKEIKKDLAHISRATDRMGDLLKGIINVSRTQQTSLNLKKVDSLKLIKEAISLLEGQMPDKDIRINLEGDFPSLVIDKAKMFKVFQNLIDNAIKYMGEQDAPKIDIGYRKYDREHLFHIRDNGMGIDEQFREKIFDLFDRLDTTTDGTGIGLTIVRRIINQHEGHIWIESSGLGKGSTFFFTLPDN